MNLDINLLLFFVVARSVVRENVNSTEPHRTSYLYQTLLQNMKKKSSCFLSNYLEE
jgi:hypothetical protein